MLRRGRLRSGSMLDIHGLGAVLSLIAVMLGVSWAVRRSTSTTLDFYLARRQIGPFLNACAICGDYFSAASFLGVAGAVYASGLDGVWFATGFAAGFLIVLLFLAAPLRRAGQFSIPDFLANRFSSQGVRLTAVGIVQVIVLIYLVPQMAGAGLTWEVLMGRGLAGLSPYATGILLTTLAIAIYAVVGGMRGTTWNQALQFSLLFFTVFLTAAIAMGRGFSYPHAVEQVSRRSLAVPATVTPERLRSPAGDGRSRLELVRSVMSPAGYQRVVARLERGVSPIHVLIPAKNRLHPDRPMRFSEPGYRYSLGQQIALIVTLLLGTAGLPHIVNRYFTSTSGRAARTSTVWVLPLAGSFYFLAVMLGVAARSELPQTVGAGTTNENFVDGVVRVPEQALLLLASELGGDPLLALVATAALAAMLSTIGGLLIAAAVSWGHDVYEQFINPYAPEIRRVRVGQVAVILTASVAAAIGVAVDGLELRPSVALMVTWAFAVAGSGFTPIFLLCVWWKRMTARGAVVGMVVGAFTALALIGMELGGRIVDWIPSVSVGSFPSIIAAPLAALVAVTVSLVTRAPGKSPALWVRMHGTAMERRQSRLARLAARGEAAL